MLYTKNKLKSFITAITVFLAYLLVNVPAYAQLAGFRKSAETARDYYSTHDVGDNSVMDFFVFVLIVGFIVVVWMFFRKK